MENTDYSIVRHCTIADHRITVNGQTVFEDSHGDFVSFAKAYYKTNNLEYPKFFKMDPLSKLAFIGAEAILDKIPLEKPTNDVAILLSNSTSSLDTDLKHYKTIFDPNEYYPSPAVFVYTLANICLAEVSIKHQLQGENTFFISPKFDVDLMFVNAEYLLKTKRAKQVLCGWVDYLEGNYKAFFYLVSDHNEMNLKHTKKNIKDLY